MAGKACDPLCRDNRRDGYWLTGWMTSLALPVLFAWQQNTGQSFWTEEMPLKHLKVHCGRLDEDEIEAFLKKDGTHLCDRCNTSLRPGGHSQYPESL